MDIPYEAHENNPDVCAAMGILLWGTSHLLPFFGSLYLIPDTMAAPNDRSQDSSRRNAQPFPFLSGSELHAAESIYLFHYSERQQLVKAKSMIKTTGLTLIAKPDAPLKDFQSFFHLRVFAPKLKSFLIVP